MWPFGPSRMDWPLDHASSHVAFQGSLEGKGKRNTGAEYMYLTDRGE